RRAEVSPSSHHSLKVRGPRRNGHGAIQPSKGLPTSQAESQREKEAAEQLCRQKREWWAAYCRRCALSNQLNNLLRSETTGGTAEVGEATALMVLPKFDSGNLSSTRKDTCASILPLLPAILPISSRTWKC